jgi:hypothetical protein
MLGICIIEYSSNHNYKLASQLFLTETDLTERHSILEDEVSNVRLRTIYRFKRVLPVRLIFCLLESEYHIPTRRHDKNRHNLCSARTQQSRSQKIDSTERKSEPRPKQIAEQTHAHTAMTHRHTLSHHTAMTHTAMTHRHTQP